MKRNLLAIALLIGASHIATAQTSGSSSTNGPSVSSSRAKSKKGQADTLGERKMYNWKDGQRATPTGHEATGTGGTAAPLPKDSATMQSDSIRHYR